MMNESGKASRFIIHDSLFIVSIGSCPGLGRNPIKGIILYSASRLCSAMSNNNVAV
jgi:hypothetical protein